MINHDLAGDLNPPLLSVRHLRLGFAAKHAQNQPLVAVDGLSFELHAGETFAILGESGCGKSATALSLLRLLPPAGRLLGGQILFEGRDLRQLSELDMRAVRGGGMAMIFQEPATSLNPVLTVAQQIAEVLACHLGLVGAAARARTLELLEAVGIANAQQQLSAYPFQLSGGMKQRVMIACALAGNPRLLLADEPTTALDVSIQAQILGLLRRLQAQHGMGVLLITHDLGVVAEMAHRVAVMYAGELVEEADHAAFFHAPTALPHHPYTQKLFSALPNLALSRGVGSPQSRLMQDSLATIPGQVPALAEMPQACRFAPRCHAAWSRCHTERPDWSEVAPGHRVRCHLLDTAARSLQAQHWPQASEGAAIAQEDAERVDPTKIQQALSVAPAAYSAVDSRAPNLLQVRDLSVSYPILSGFLRRKSGQVDAVDQVSFDLARGRTLALVGESGCGKTTLAKAILQLIASNSGSVQLEGLELSTLSQSALRPVRRRMQMIFQDPFASLNPRLSVFELIVEGMRALNVLPALGAADRAGQDAALANKIALLLQQVGLDPSASERYPHEFSGGQRQRIAIARALAVQAELIVCDEPTSALDVSVQAQILNLLKSLQAQFGLAYLLITHNFSVVAYLAHEVAVMYRGRIVEQGAVDEILRQPRHPYTQALLAAVPDPWRARVLGGDLPEPVVDQSSLGMTTALTGAHPSLFGCAFRQRCPRASELCRSHDPALLELTPGHQVRCHHPLH
ncbi:MAG: dipeptide ABC transporter ATP-binding protein [Pseudomonadota bacterium]